MQTIWLLILFVSLLTIVFVIFILWILYDRSTQQQRYQRKRCYQLLQQQQQLKRQQASNSKQINTYSPVNSVITNQQDMSGTFVSYVPVLNSNQTVTNGTNVTVNFVNTHHNNYSMSKGVGRSLLKSFKSSSSSAAPTSSSNKTQSQQTSTTTTTTLTSAVTNLDTVTTTTSPTSTSTRLVDVESKIDSETSHNLSNDSRMATTSADAPQPPPSNTSSSIAWTTTRCVTSATTTTTNSITATITPIASSNTLGLAPVIATTTTTSTITSSTSTSSCSPNTCARPMIKTKRPIKWDQFAKYYEDLSKDSNYGFYQEYETLNQLCKETCYKQPQLRTQSSKNRYANIVPYVHSIVKIKPFPGRTNSEYINANFVPGLHSETEYIASQAPLRETMDDFYRMLLEHKVAIIVNLLERENPAYFPIYVGDMDSEMERELFVPPATAPPLEPTTDSMELLQQKVWAQAHVKKIRLHLDRIDSRKNFDIKYVQFVREDGTVLHQVCQFHYKTWIDFGTPDNTTSLVEVVRTVRGYIATLDRATKERPIVVHCSAGVGRTGTYIAVDQLWQMLAAKSGGATSDAFLGFLGKRPSKLLNMIQSATSPKPTIDIFGLVYRLRGYRPFLVQTENQYAFIYDCVRSILKNKSLLEPIEYEDRSTRQAPSPIATPTSMPLFPSSTSSTSISTTTSSSTCISSYNQPIDTLTTLSSNVVCDSNVNSNNTNARKMNSLASVENSVSLHQKIPLPSSKTTVIENETTNTCVANNVVAGVIGDGGGGGDGGGHDNDDYVDQNTML